MDEQRLDDQLETIYNSSVPIQDIALKTSQERWTIEMSGERGSGRFVLAVRHDDDDDDDDDDEDSLSLKNKNCKIFRKPKYNTANGFVFKRWNVHVWLRYFTTKANLHNFKAQKT